MRFFPAFALLTLVMAGCQSHPLDEQAESEPVPDPIALMREGVFSDVELGVRFEYPTDWPTPSIEEEGGLIYFLKSEGYELYDWRINLGEMEEACEGSPCYLQYLQGPVTEDLDAIKSLLEEKSEELLANLIFDEQVGENRVLAYGQGGICGDLVAFISNGAETVVYTGRCSVSYDSETQEDYIYKTEIETVLRQIAGSLEFVGY